MYTIDHSELPALIKHVTFDLKMPVMIWGPPGAGKSVAVRQAADVQGALLVDIRLGQYDSVDLRGIPVPHESTTVWHMPSTLPFVGNPAFPTDRPILLFFDEINGATPAVSGVAYQLILDRACGEHKLMDNVFMIAAGNREGDKGVTNKMPLPLANRMCHVELAVTSDAVIDYMMGRVPAECVAFLAFRRPLVSTFDPTRPAKAFATPRTWERAFEVYKSSAPAAVKRIAVAGWVGEGPASEFWAFIDCMDKVIPIKTILRDPHNAPIPEELSMRYATAVSVSGAMNPDNVDALHTYLNRYDPEFVVLAWQMALKRSDALLASNAFMKVAADYRELFRQ